PAVETNVSQYCIISKLRLPRKHCNRANSSLAGHHLLDVKGGDVLAAAAYCVLEAIDECEVAVGIHRHPAPRMEPEIAPGLDRLVRHCEIARRKRKWLVGTQYQFTGDTWRERIVLLIDHPRVEAACQAA